MNTSKKIEFLRNGLVEYFHKPTFIQFTDGYGSVYAGISRAIREVPRNPCDMAKPILQIEIPFAPIVRVKLVKPHTNYISEYYIPELDEPKRVIMRFSIVKIETVLMPRTQNNHHVHAWVTDHPKERIVFSSLQKDFERFSHEVLRIETSPNAK